MLGRETKVESAAWADIDGLAAELENTYNGFDDEGYDVVNVVPVQSGSSEYRTDGTPSHVPYSITRTLLVVGRRRG